MKNILKAFILISLFASAGFAAPLRFAPPEPKVETLPECKLNEPPIKCRSEGTPLQPEMEAFDLDKHCSYHTTEAEVKDVVDPALASIIEAMTLLKDEAMRRQIVNEDKLDCGPNTETRGCEPIRFERYFLQRCINGLNKANAPKRSTAKKSADASAKLSEEGHVLDCVTYSEIIFPTPDMRPPAVSYPISKQSIEDGYKHLYYQSSIYRLTDACRGPESGKYKQLNR